MSEPVVWLTIFILSVFVGIEVISKVSSTLHTPLMSGANAIHGIILLGAILVGDTEDYVVTREFRALSTPEQRVDILRACFAIGVPVTVEVSLKPIPTFGAGLQLSPNATNILEDLGVLDRLAPWTLAPWSTREESLSCSAIRLTRARTS